METRTTELLLQFGLTRQEAKIYVLLLQEGPLSGYEAAKRSGISRSNAYAVLAALVDKGAAYISEEQSIQYQAVDIAEFCENKLHFMKEVAQELKSCLPEKVKRNENYITIRGKRHVEDKFRNMLKSTQERVYLSVPSSLLEMACAELELLIAQGKKVVLITEIPCNLDGAIIYQTDKEDTQIRMITDSTYALTGEMSDLSEPTCLYSENPNLVKLLKEALANEIKLIQMGTKEDNEIL